MFFYCKIILFLSEIEGIPRNYLVRKQTLNHFGFESCCFPLNSDIPSVLSKEFLDIQATIE